MTTGFAVDDYVKSLEDRIAALEKVADNLAAMVKRLVYSLRSNDNATDLRRQAMEYLRQNGLDGNILREAGYLGGGE